MRVDLVVERELVVGERQPGEQRVLVEQEVATVAANMSNWPPQLVRAGTNVSWSGAKQPYPRKALEEQIVLGRSSSSSPSTRCARTQQGWSCRRSALHDDVAFGEISADSAP
jgi:hypothetical protein